MTADLVLSRKVSLTRIQRQEGQKLLRQCDDLCTEANKHLIDAKDSLFKIGRIAGQIVDNRYYILDGFNSAVKWRKALSEKIGTGIKQLYSYEKVQRLLCSTGASDEDLEEIGISKATTLLSLPPSSVTKEVLNYAKNPKLTEANLRQALTACGVKDNRPQTITVSFRPFEFEQIKQTLDANSMKIKNFLLSNIGKKAIKEWIKSSEYLKSAQRRK